MDEILIEEKKYVSSKQAAKLTGYAKDYVGQLCREGRVPARLVGRSWYVLESAIADHRFGNQVESKDKDVEQTKESVPVVSKTWEFPRYEAVQTEVLLPSINRLQEDLGEKVPSVSEDSEEKAADVSQDIQESWKEWFDRVGNTVPDVENPILPISAVNSTALEEDFEPEKIKENDNDKEVSVPLHVMSRYFPYEEPTQEEAQQIQARESKMPVPLARSNLAKIVARLVQTIGILIALIVVTIATIGSGYVDKYTSILSNKQVSIISGLTVFNK